MSNGNYVFAPPTLPSVAVAGTEHRFPVNRIFCVGRNYAAHAREMGFEPDREAPFYFTKSPSTLTASGSTISYPSGTSNFHHEIELVIALGKPGFEVSVEDATSLVYGYACGLDMTRRDLQLTARDAGRPWSLGKDVEDGAVVGPIQPWEFATYPSSGRIWLSVNEDLRQESDLGDLIWSVPEIVSHLSGFYHLRPGDLIFTGTPDGVGPVRPGDVVRGGIAAVGDIELRIAQE